MNTAGVKLRKNGFASRGESVFVGDKEGGGFAELFLKKARHLFDCAGPDFERASFSSSCESITERDVRISKSHSCGRCYCFCRHAATTCPSAMPPSFGGTR